MKKYLIVKVTTYCHSGNEYLTTISYDDWAEAIHMYEIMREYPLASVVLSEKIYLNKVLDRLDDQFTGYETLMSIKKVNMKWKK